MSAINQSGELDGLRAPQIGDRIHRGANRAAREQHVINKDDNATINALGWNLRVRKGASRLEAQVIAVHGDVNRAHGNVRIINLAELCCDASREWDSPTRDSEQDHVIATFVAFNDFMSDAR
jgi:hypothetical protein